MSRYPSPAERYRLSAHLGRATRRELGLCLGEPAAPWANAIARAAFAIFEGKRPAPVLRPRPSGLLAGPTPCGEFFVETWRKGPESSSRIRALRRLLGSTVSQRTTTENQRLGCELGADRVSVQKVEITYCLGVAASPRRAA